MELLLVRSQWCGGYDIRLRYRRVPAEPLSDRALIRHYFAHFNRRDAHAVSSLFAATGSLVEPFTATGEGAHRRHAGRKRIRDWYAAAFGGVAWSAIRLTGIAPAGAPDPGQYVATWEYMDSGLEAPIGGRNLFLVAAGEIYETELQLTTGTGVEAVDRTVETGESSSPAFRRTDALPGPLPP
jgi:hypothetical protein